MCRERNPSETLIEDSGEATQLSSLSGGACLAQEERNHQVL